MPRIQTSVCMIDLCGRPRRNVIRTFEQTSELSNDYNDDTINNNVLEDDNYENPITIGDSITPA